MYRLVGIFNVDAPTMDLAEEYVKALVVDDMAANPTFITDFNITVSREFADCELPKEETPKKEK